MLSACTPTRRSGHRASEPCDRTCRTAALFLVQLQRFPPRFAGLLVLAEGGIRMAEPVESVGDLVGVADVAEQGESLV